MPRAILHADLDAFFASVEQLDDMALRGKPVLVGGGGRRGVVAAASYEARTFGCRSAMPTAVALRLCPQAVVVKPRGHRYRELSDQIFAIYDDFTPLVQPLSIDEAFLDVTGSVPLLGPPIDQARQIRRRVKDATGLTVSVGVAPNKFLAKLASDLDKPDGLTLIDPDRIHHTLDPLPVTKLWGVGPAAEKTLARLGLRTIGDIRHYPEHALVAKLGDFGAHIAALARGDDDRPVTPDREAKSIGHEQTFGENLTDPAEVRSVMLAQSEAVARRARKHARAFAGVTVKIRFGDFQTVTRSVTLDAPTDTTDTLASAARALFDTWCKEPAGFRPVRLIGVTATHLSGAADATPQPTLFVDDTQKANARRAIDQATDAIADRYGNDSIRRAGAYAPKKRVGFDHSNPGDTELDD
ncbi:MAG: DNA polymerase IV [Planctomycetota bacterium]